MSKSKRKPLDANKWWFASQEEFNKLIVDAVCGDEPDYAKRKLHLVSKFITEGWSHIGAVVSIVTARESFMNGKQTERAR